MQLKQLALINKIPRVSNFQWQVTLCSISDSSTGFFVSFSAQSGGIFLDCGIVSITYEHFAKYMLTTDRPFSIP